MKKNYITPVDRSRDFKFEELFFSTTDRKGIIQSCNDIFVRLSGYESSELIGEPHNVIRHPEMPACVYKLFWEYLLSDRPVCAYVKNMAKTGEYYWVFAFVMPVEEGFLSIRIKPMSTYFGVVKELYKNLKLTETTSSDYKEGMNNAYDQLSSELATLGFSSYDEFLSTVLRAEVSLRIDHMKSHCKLDRELWSIYDVVLSLVNNNTAMIEEKNNISSFAAELELVALNSTVKASMLGRDGLPISVIGQEISKMSGIIKQETSKLSDLANDILKDINLASNNLMFALLQEEMAQSFDADMFVNSRNSQSLALNSQATFLRDVANKGNEKTVLMIKSLKENVARFDELLDSLSKVFSVLAFSYVTGCTEAARISKEKEFLPLLDRLRDLSHNAKGSLQSLSENIVYFSERHV